MILIIQKENISKKLKKIKINKDIKKKNLNEQIKDILFKFDILIFKNLKF